jgi:hypothetical protein
VQLNDKILMLMKAGGISPADLGSELKVGEDEVNRWIDGSSSPDVFQIVALATALGASTDTLLNDSVVLTVSGARSEKTEPTADTRLAKTIALATLLPFLLPVLVCGALMTLAALVFGGTFTSLGYGLSAALMLGSVSSVILLFSNTGSGAGTICICISGVFLGLGSSLLLWRASGAWTGFFKRVVRAAVAKLGSIDLKELMK